MIGTVTTLKSELVFEHLKRLLIKCPVLIIRHEIDKIAGEIWSKLTRHREKLSLICSHDCRLYLQSDQGSLTNLVSEVLSQFISVIFLDKRGK